jgi:LemA protein
MPNALDEVTGPRNSGGREVAVIDKQLPVTIGVGSAIFEAALWTVGVIPGIILLIVGALPTLTALLVMIAGALPGLVFVFMKIGAGNYFSRQEQRIQAYASEIDNYCEQRLVILQNVVKILERAIDLDKDVLKSVAAFRSRIRPESQVGVNVNQIIAEQDRAFLAIAAAQEAYPELRAHATLADAMRQNSYLQKEITAARSLYNDAVAQWNMDLFSWPTKQIVAARRRYTTRIPFILSQERKEASRQVFF